MVKIEIDVDRVDRIIENLIRISEAYQQKALEFESRHNVEGDHLAGIWREKSHLAAEDAHVLQLSLQSLRG